MFIHFKFVRIDPLASIILLFFSFCIISLWLMGQYITTYDKMERL